jgi:hypothetical protein
MFFLASGGYRCIARDRRVLADRSNPGISNFVERYRNGETIRTAFVESTLNELAD